MLWGKEGVESKGLGMVQIELDYMMKHIWESFVGGKVSQWYRVCENRQQWVRTDENW